MKQYIQITLVVGDNEHTLFDRVFGNKIDLDSKVPDQEFTPRSGAVGYTFDPGTAAHAAEKRKKSERPHPKQKEQRPPELA